IIEIAERDVDRATSLHQFTRYLNEAFSLEQKIHLLTTLWLVAVSDGQVDKYEDHMIRKIADLLHLRHSEFIQCKQQAMQQHGA
ncbi:MAG: TerB family tellurite resistance protein, partial [Bermanella sp.]